MSIIKEVLLDHPTFRELSTDHLALIESVSREINFHKGEKILQEGMDASEFFIIQDGKVSIDVHEPTRGYISIQTLEKREILGWSWLIPPHHWRFDAHAVNDVKAISIDGQFLKKQCETNNDLALELYKSFSYIISQRLSWTHLQLLDVYGKNK